MRFNLNADTVEEAIEYFKNRGLQLRKFGWEILIFNPSIFEGAVYAYFKNKSTNVEAVSIYILESYRGNGLYEEIWRSLLKPLVLTSKECNMADYLSHKRIPYLFLTIGDTEEYQIISKFYGDDKAKRSGQYFMNHIDEGLGILHDISASETAKKAYTIHPVVQSDASMTWENIDLLKNLDYRVLACLFEYRNIANAYLSKREIKSESEIALSPLDDVNLMLYADKLQNQKDFLLYHFGKHERSDILNQYFLNWIGLLNEKYGLHAYYKLWLVQNNLTQYISF